MSVADRPDRPPRALQRVRSLPTAVQDGAIVVAVLLAQFVSLATGGEEADGARTADAGAYALAITATVPLLLRRRRPLVALGAALAAMVALAAFGYAGVVVGYAILVAVYSVSAHRTLIAGIVAGATAIVTLLVSYRIGAWNPDVGDHVADILAVGVAVALGDGTRTRLRLADETAARRAAAAGERARLAEQTVMAERARIARELHDLVAHSMSIVTVQAGMGHHLIDRDPAKAKEALGTIETTSRQALTEMRRMLGLLREPGETSRSGVSLGPQPGSDDIVELVDAARAGGLHVDLALSPESAVHDLPSGVALSAYRIIQEALTNIRKHAHAAHVTVALDRRPDELVIAVHDDGRGVSTMTETEGGFGLVGMRERAAAVGGELEAGPRPGGGFRVRATLPLQEHR